MFDLILYNKLINKKNVKHYDYFIRFTIQAGIPDDQLNIALEPEAAAIYCKELAVARLNNDGSEAMLHKFDQGSQFMVLDLGG